MDLLLAIAASLGILLAGFLILAGLMGIVGSRMLKSWKKSKSQADKRLRDSDADFKVLFSTLERKAIRSTELVYEYFGPTQAQWEFMLDTDTGLRVHYDLLLSHREEGSAWEAEDSDLFERLYLLLYAPCCSSMLVMEDLPHTNEYRFKCKSCSALVGTYEDESIGVSDLNYVSKREAQLRSWIAGSVQDSNPLEHEIQASQLSDELVALTKLLILHFRDELRQEKLSRDSHE